MKVIQFEPNTIQRNIEEQKRTDLVNLVDTLKQAIEEGKIQSFVGVALTDDNEVQTYIGCEDALVALGLYEIGKDDILGR